MNIQKLEKLARRVVGRAITIEVGAGAYTDGSKIIVLDPDSRWPKLPLSAKNDMAEFLTGHEASHIKRLDQVARKLGKVSVSAEEFYQFFADPLSPGDASKGYVRFMLNVVEDQLVDTDAAGFVGKDTRERVNKFFVWNRQGGGRKSIAELEAGGKPGQCAAFVEALFQLEIYGELIESFVSPLLILTAKQAAKVMASYGKGSLSRSQALQGALAELRKYCPPPWSLPPEYQPPKGEGAGKGGDPSADPSTGSQGQGEGNEGSGEGSGDGSEKGQGKGKGQKGQKSKPGKGEGEGSGDSDGEGSGDGESSDSSGKPSDGKEGKDGEKSSKDSKGKGDKAEAEESEGEDDPEPGSESEGGGDGSPSESNSRGAEIGGGAGDPRAVESAPEKRFEDNNLEALLRMLERVLAERTKQIGRGMPRFRSWQPGDAVSSPDEICRYQEDEVFGTDPLKRRCVRRRDKEQHLMAVFIDSSGSVSNDLFSQLYRVCGELAEKVGQSQGIKLGVGQFSGGASWVLIPTQDVQAIRDFAEEAPMRLYSGGTTVGEIYGLLPDDFAGYETADLIVLTDGYVEDGKALAESLEKAHSETGCEIKLHGVVFRKMGSLKQFAKAKDDLPEFVRAWHLGAEE